MTVTCLRVCGEGFLTVKDSETRIDGPVRRKTSGRMRHRWAMPTRPPVASDAAAQTRIEQERSLSDCFGRLQDRLLRMAQVSLPASSSVGPEDLVQTIFLEAWFDCLADPSFLPGDGWFFLRLRSRIVDCRRRHYREKRLETAGPLPEPGPSPEELAVHRLALEELMLTIPDPFDRVTLGLRIQGFPESEIAEMLNLPRNSRKVRDRLKRIRKRARRNGEDGWPGGLST